MGRFFRLDSCLSVKHSLLFGALSSIREIAEHTGLSTATVSLALRDVGRIPEVTRQRVKAAADELGYQAQPLLSKALSLIRQPKEERYRETLAFLTEFSLDDPTLDPYPLYQKLLFTGASERARTLGFKLESFTLSGKPSEHRRVGRVLHARGIRGLIIIPRVKLDQPRLSFNWNHFVSVEIGRTLWFPRNLHRVETADYNKIIEVLHLLKKAGYRRIGMAVEPQQNKHQRGSYYSAYLLSQLKQPVRQRIPIAFANGEWNEKTFRAWMKHYRPDVLIVHDLASIVRWLKNLNLRVPEDVSVFCANVQDDYHSGLRRDYSGMGAQAVEMASIMLESGQLGLRENPRCWQVDEMLQPGQTLSRSIAPYISSRGFLLTTPPR